MLERNPSKTSIKLIVTYANTKPELSTISAAIAGRYRRVGNPRDPNRVPDVVEVPTGVNAGDGMNSGGVVAKYCEVKYFEGNRWRFRTREHFNIADIHHIPYSTFISICDSGGDHSFVEGK